MVTATPMSERGMLEWLFECEQARKYARAHTHTHSTCRNRSVSIRSNSHWHVQESSSRHKLRECGGRRQAAHSRYKRRRLLCNRRRLRCSQSEGLHFGAGCKRCICGTHAILVRKQPPAAGGQLAQHAHCATHQHRRHFNRKINRCSTRQQNREGRGGEIAEHGCCRRGLSGRERSRQRDECAQS